MIFAGGGAGTDQFGYAGFSAPLPGSDLGSGWGVRATVAASGYDYESSGLDIDGRQIRGEIMLLRSVSGPGGYFSLGVGPRYVDTHLSPRDPGARHRDQWDAAISADGGTQSGPWRAGFYASYGVDRQEYYVQGDVTHAVGAMTRIGVEAAFDGGRDYDRYRVGAVVGFAPNPGWEIKLSAGSMHSGDHDSAYGAVSFTRAF